MAHFHRFKQFLAAVFVLSIIAGCDSGSSRAPNTGVTLTDPPPPVVDEPVGVVPTAPNSFMAGTAGGSTSITVNNQEFLITIPAGAVAETVEITVTELGQPDVEAAFPGLEQTPMLALDLQPAGTLFTQPIQLSMVLPTSATNLDLFFGILESDGAYEPLAVTLREESAEQRLTFDVPHFSKAIILTAGFGVTASLIDNNNQERNNYLDGDGGIARYNVFQEPGAPEASFIFRTQSTRDDILDDDFGISSFEATDNILLFSNAGPFPKALDSPILSSRNQTNSNVSENTEFRFQCQSVGPFTITASIVGIVEFNDFSSLLLRTLQQRTSISFSRLLNLEGQCIPRPDPIPEPDPTPDPDPVPDPTPDPDPVPDPTPDPVPDPVPILMDDEAQTVVGEVVTIDVLDNDVNVAEGQEHIVVFPGDSPTLEQPMLGVVTRELDTASGRSEALYTPTSFAGQDSFEYRIINASDATVIATARVTVNILPLEQGPLDELIIGNQYRALNFGSSTLVHDFLGTAVGGGSPSDRPCQLPIGLGDTSDIARMGSVNFNCPGDPDTFVIDSLPANPDNSSLPFTITNNSNPSTTNLVINVGQQPFTASATNADGSAFTAPDVLPRGMDTSRIELSTSDNFFVVGDVGDNFGDSLLIKNINGLDSLIEYDSFLFGSIRVSAYDATQQEPGKLSGFSEVRPSTDGQNTGTANRSELPLFSPSLRTFLQDNNRSLDSFSRIAISAVAQIDVPDIFQISPPASGVAGVNSTVAVGAGVNVLIDQPVEVLSPPVNVCTSRPANVRCTVPVNAVEMLLSVNNSDDVATYSAFDGTHQGFFIGGGPAPTFGFGRGHQASQGPGNCVLYTDAEGDVFLYDVDGNRIVADGLGNINASGAGPLLAGSAQTDAVGSYTGFDFHSPDGSSWHLYLTVLVDTTGNNFSDTARLIRYDYATIGDTVLTNPVVLVEEANGDFNDVLVIDDRIYLSDASPDSSSVAQDLVRVFALDGTPMTSLVTDAVTPNQLSATFDGGIILADFARERFLNTGLDGVPRRDYRVGNNDGGGNDRVNGVYPLRNGNYLVSGFSEINRSVLNRADGSLMMVPDGRSTIGQFFGNACLAP